FLAKFITGLGRRDRHRDDDRFRFHLAERGDRSAHRRAGSQSVVDDDHRFVAHIERWTRTAIFALAPLELPLLARGNFIDRFLWQGDVAEDVAVEDADAAGGDRSHGQLFVAGYSEFSDDENIQRSVERLR